MGCGLEEYTLYLIDHRYIITVYFNSLPNDKTLDWSKLKAFADDKINVNQKLKFDMGIFLG